MNTVIEPQRVNHQRAINGDNEVSIPISTPLGQASSRVAEIPCGELGIHWSWACRKLPMSPQVQLEEAPTGPPMPGDLALVRMDIHGYHKHLTTAQNRRLRFYQGAQFVGVFGNRYATRAYEAEVLTTDNLNLLTGAGMIGTVKSKHGAMPDPTQLTFLGFLKGADGARLNMKNHLFRPAAVRSMPPNLIYVVGTSMNSGKTTTCARLIRGLSEMGLNVVACKLTGSVSNHDPDELAAASAAKVTDFSDFGFASTYLSPKEELIELFRAMVADVAVEKPDVVLMEFADGLLQRETAMLLNEPEIREAGRGVVLAAGGSLSALWGVDWLRRAGHRIIAVSGRLTSSPLEVREYSEHESDTPVVSSSRSPLVAGVELVAWVNAFLKRE